MARRWAVSGRPRRSVTRRLGGEHHESRVAPVRLGLPAAKVEDLVARGGAGGVDEVAEHVRTRLVRPRLEGEVGLLEPEVPLGALEGDHAWRQDVVHRQGERASAGEGGHGGGWRGWFEAVRDQRLGTWGIRGGGATMEAMRDIGVSVVGRGRRWPALRTMPCRGESEG
jgi:hypothetical protein